MIQAVSAVVQGGDSEAALWELGKKHGVSTVLCAVEFLAQPKAGVATASAEPGGLAAKAAAVLKRIGCKLER